MTPAGDAPPEPAPDALGGDVVTRTDLAGFSLLCLDHYAPWWWPLARILPEWCRPRTPHPEYVKWERCDDATAGPAARRIIAAQNRHAHLFPRHRTIIRESGTLTFSVVRDPGGQP